MLKEYPPSTVDLPTDPSRNAVILAAAGTGKTWLLIGRLVRLLLAGAAPGAILAITFTRKAAAEIQLRLRQRLLTLSEADDAELANALIEIGLTPGLAELSRARALYDELLTSPYEVRATTFHAFCHELLQRFPLEAGIAPNFILLETTSEWESAAFRALDADLGKGDAILEQAIDTLLQECGGLSNTHHALQDFLTHRGDWWALTEEADDEIGVAVARLQKKLAPHGTDIDPRIAFATDPAMRDAIAQYLGAFGDAPVGRHQTTLERLRAALAPNLTPENFYRFTCEALLTEKGDARVFKPTNALVSALGADNVDRLLQQYGQLQDRLRGAIDRYRYYRTWRRTRAWYIAGHRLLGHYQRLKREQHALDFTDLEWLTYRLLTRGRHAEWVQYKLDQRIDHLLVDEFQDTNPTQWRLLQPLLEEVAAGSVDRPRSVFIVGDAKQSIYRFRRADAALLGRAHDWLQQHGAALVYNQHISWRSSPAITEFVNAVFVSPTEARTDDFHLPEFQCHETHHRQRWGHAELLPLIPRTPPTAAAAAAFRNPLQQPRVLEEDQRHRSEGECIAAKILSLIGAPIDDRGTTRPLNYGDVMILLRDRRYAAAYETALRDAHIPYVGAGRGTFLDALEVRDMLQLLNVLISPFDDVALATVLRSPLFAASNEDLARLALIDDASTWYERLQLHAAAAEPNAPLARAAKLLPAWRAHADRIPVHDLLDRIYYEADVPERYQSAAPAPLRARVKANLLRLLDLALEADAGRFSSLARFIVRLEGLTQDDNEALGTDHDGSAGNGVRVLTIHGAKGLESPVVFLADSTRTNVSQRERGVRALIEWPIDSTQPTLFLLAAGKSEADAVSRQAMERQTQSALREESNLLYVALTRARQLLYVSGCEPGTRNQEPTRAGDSSRGWYGFIERQLQAAASTNSALDIRLLPHPNGSDAYNVVATLRHGTAPALTPAIQDTKAPKYEIDPALTRPFPVRSTERAVIRPSMEHTRTGNQPDQSEAKRRGVVIHRMLQCLTESTAARAEIHERIVKEFEGEIAATLIEACWQEACAVVDAPVFAHLFDPSHYREARNELAILYREDDADITGIIDRVVIRERELILMDYKTDRVEDATIDTLAALYTPQLLRYAQGLRRVWPNHRIDALLLFTAVRKAVPVNL